MKLKIVLITSICLLFAIPSWAQFWSGTSNTTSPISRTGRVQINGMRYERYNGVIAGFTNPYLILGASTTEDDELVFGGNSGAKMDVRLLDGILKVGGSASPFTQLSRDELTDSWIGGNLGVGTNTPDYRLDVNGDMFINYNPDYNTPTGWKTTRLWYIGHSFEMGSEVGAARTNYFKLKPGGVNGGTTLHSILGLYSVDGEGADGTEKIRFHSNADSYINTGNRLLLGTDNTSASSNPNELLVVAGGVFAREVRVEVTAGNDKVFAEDYPLMDLNLLDAYLSNERHLPGIAPEREMLKEGVELGEFSIELLGKIEELTLYTIEQHKQLEAMQQQIEELQLQLAADK